MRNRAVSKLAVTVGAFTLFVALTLLAQPDRYSLKVPGGLAFSEFSGYESWQVISVSHNGNKLAVILGNPAMIDAYKAGIPVNGGPFPDGAKMAKIHWNALKAETYPGPTTVPGTLHEVDFYRFSEAGDYSFCCWFHPKMIGKVIVQPYNGGKPKDTFVAVGSYAAGRSPTVCFELGF